MYFAVIGLGSFGIKRAGAVKNSKLANLIPIHDVNEDNAKKLLSKDLSHMKPISYMLEIDNFINNLNNKKECSPSAEDGLEIMKMIEYIYSDQ